MFICAGTDLSQLGKGGSQPQVEEDKYLEVLFTSEGGMER